MSRIPFSELVKRATLNDSSSQSFKIVADSVEKFFTGILENNQLIVRGISEHSASRNSDGEYVFEDGRDGNEIVVGIKGYMTKVKMRQYRTINALSDAMFGDKIRDIRRELVDTIKTIFLPWILVDVLIGLPIEEKKVFEHQFNLISTRNLPDNITYDQVDVFRRYMAGTAETDVVKKTLDELGDLMLSEEKDFPSIPNKNQLLIEIIRSIFNVLFREKMLAELVRVIEGLKDVTTTNVPNIKPLYESYAVSQRAKYASKCKSLIGELYPGEVVSSRVNPTHSNIRYEYYEHSPITTNTVFEINEEIRDERHRSATSVKCLRTTNDRYQYSNDGLGHVLLQTIQFGRWWGGMTMDSVNLSIGLIVGIVAGLEIVDSAGFIPINIPPNGADIARDVIITDDEQKINPFIPKNAQFPQRHRVENPDLSLIIDKIKHSNNLENGVKYSYLKFLHVLLSAHDVIMVEKFHEVDGHDMQIDIGISTKNMIRRILEEENAVSIEKLVSGMTTFENLCMVDGVWDISKLNDFVMNKDSIDMVLHGDLTQGGVSKLFDEHSRINCGFTDNPDVVDVKVNDDSMYRFDITEQDIRRNITISGDNGIQYIPIVVQIYDTSTLERFVESCSEIFTDKYVSRGSLFTDMVGHIMINAIKPVGILGTTIGYSLEAVARIMSIFIPLIAIQTNLVAMPAKYTFSVAVQNNMSQYPLFGLGQVVGRPIMNGMKSAYLMAQLISLIGIGVIRPNIVRYIDVPLRQIWSAIVKLLSKNVLIRDSDLVGVKYPTRFTYLKRVDRISRYGDNNILDRNDATLVAKLVLNEYLYEIVWNKMKNEWYSYNGMIVDRLRDFIENEGVSEDIKSLFDDYYFGALNDALTRETSIVGHSVSGMLSNIFADSNRNMLFPDYTDFIRVCTSQNKNTVDKETGEPVSYQTCTRISCERADLVVYESVFREIFPDISLDEIGLLSTVRGINNRLGGDVITGNQRLDNVIRNFPFELTELSTDGSFQKSVIGLFDETIDDVKKLGEKMLQNIMNY